MIWDNAFDTEPRKRAFYLFACDAIFLGIPRYYIDWGSLDRKEIEIIWKRAKRCVLGKPANQA